MKNKHLSYICIYLIISFSFSILFIGKDNFWFDSTNWLYGSGDLTNAQLSWKFYLNDIWRFPLGLNPNYGMEIANSIVFTDNIPLLAIFFKIFKHLISYNFQYFSFWVFISFFLQLLLSYFLVNKILKNNFYSFLSSFFFLLAPFLLFRMTHHFSLGGHWLILYSLYTLFFIEEKKKNKHWYTLIFLSLLVHLYFTVMIFVIHFFEVLENCIKNKRIKNEFINVVYKFLFSIIIMFVIGYFESSPINAVSSGYGLFKIDLLSFFDPKISGDQFSWSMILEDLPGTHFEGFTYIGLGNVLLIFLSLFIFLKNKLKKKIDDYEIYFFNIRNFSFVILLLWAVTTNISILGYEILNIQLPKYMFAALSIFSSTGRFAWPIIYVMVLFSIIVLYKNFSKNYSYVILSIFLLIQIVDISPVLKDGLFKKNTINQKNYNDPIWNYINEEFEMLRTTYLFHNYGPLFSNISVPISKMNKIKTDIILNAAMDRQKAALVRYKLANNVKKYKLDLNTAYIVDNLEHLNQLKFQLATKNYGFFYRDNFWIILPGKKELMTELDFINLNKITFNKIEKNKKYNLKFKDNFLGFGWSHNFGKEGAWSEGDNSFILIEIPEREKNNFELEFSYLPYKKNKKENYEFSIFINNIFYKKVKVNDQNMINIPLNYTNGQNKFLINFEFNGIISPYDTFESPDARKLGILAKSVRLKEVK